MIIGTLYSIDFEGVEKTELLDDADQLVTCLAKIIDTSNLEVVGEPMIHRSRQMN